MTYDQVTVDAFLMELGQELTRKEYEKLVAAAPGRIGLIMETLCATGIRVSEFAYITAEAVGVGRTHLPAAGVGGDEGGVQKTGVDPRKVFPHNLRHLFARVLDWLGLVIGT